MREDQSPAPVAGAVEALVADARLAMAMIEKRDDHYCRKVIRILDRLAALHPQPAPAVAVEAERELFETWAREKNWFSESCFVWDSEADSYRGDLFFAYEAWLAARSAPAVAESQWISVEDSRPEFIGEEDTPVWTWDGHQVREDNYGLEWDQPAGPVVGGWVVTGEGFQDDTLGTVTHWMPRTPPAPPTVGSGSAQEGQANG